jgi:Fic family protein
MPYISHEKLVEDNKPEYYISLRKSQKIFKTKKPDISYWLNFFLDIILKQSQMAVELLSEENIEKLLSKNQLIVWEYLQTVEEASPIEIMKKTNVKRPIILITASLIKDSLYKPIHIKVSIFLIH